LNCIENNYADFRMRNYPLLVFIASWTITFTTYAQPRTDSLFIQRQLDTVQQHLSNDHADQAIAVASRALQNAEQVGHVSLIPEALICLARACHAADRQGSTLKYYLKAINVLENQENEARLVSLYMEMASLYNKWNLKQRALEYYLKAYQSPAITHKSRIKSLEHIAYLNVELGNHQSAIDSYKKLTSQYREIDEPSFIRVHKTLATLYKTNNRFDESLHSSATVLEYYQSQKDTARALTWLSEIGYTSYINNNFSQAVRFYQEYFLTARQQYPDIQKSPEKLRFIENKISVGKMYEQLADQEYLNDYENALTCYTEAFQLNNATVNSSLSAKILNRVAEVYLKSGDHKTSISYAEASLMFAEQAGDWPGISQSNLLLARNFEAMDMYENALRHQKVHAAVKDSILTRQIKERDARYIENTKMNTRKNILERTEEMIMEEEVKELALKKLQLQADKKEKELQILQQEKELQSARLHNEQLERIKTQQELDLLENKLDAKNREQKIRELENETALQELQKKEQQKEMELLNKDNLYKALQISKADSQRKYYKITLALISIIFTLILAGYYIKRRSNRKLHHKNLQIEHQSRQLQQSYKSLNLLSEIGKQITSNLIIEEIVHTVYEHLNRLLDAPVFGIGLYDPDNNCLKFPGVKEKGERLEDFSISLDEERLAVVCFNQQKEILVNNFEQESANYLRIASDPIQGNVNASSIIYIPLTLKAHKLGVLTVQSFNKCAFSAHDLNIVRNIANYAKIALENARAYEEIAQTSQHLKSANENIVAQKAIIEDQNNVLLKVNKEKNNIIGILAHDLRNPLSTAQSMASFIGMQSGHLTDEQRQALDIIYRAMERMNDMIKKILDVKAIESQNLKVELSPVDMLEIVSSVAQTFASDLSNKQIDLTMRVPEDPVWVQADQNYLVQVIDNLLSNAIKFSYPGSGIVIIIERQAHEVLFSVKDNGPGLTGDDHKKLFNKYQKLSAKPTGGEQSLGLGLSIVKKYVEAMNGHVWCESVPGEGATFYVGLKNEEMWLVNQ